MPSSRRAEVRSSILYATILIILVFLPVIGLSGVEGRLFTPIAIATQGFSSDLPALSNSRSRMLRT